MPELLHKKIHKLLSLKTFAALMTALLIFGGKYGLSSDPQSSGLSAISVSFHENFFQIRWWALGGLLVLAVCDFTLSRRPLIRQRRLPLGLIGFLLVLVPLLVSITYAGGSEHTARKFVDLIALTAIIVGVHYWASKPSRIPYEFGQLVLVFCLGIGLVLALAAAATADFTDRLSFGEGGPNTFVRIVGVTALASLGLKFIPRPIAILMTLGLLMLVVLTQSRGGLLACVAALGLLFVRTFSWRQQIIYVGSLVSGLALIAIFTELGQHCVEIVQDRFINKTFHDGYTAGRDTIFSDSINIWHEKFLFGHGLNSWWDRLGMYPHNIFLELGCDAGVVAVLGFIVLLGMYAWEAFRCRDQTSITISCAVPLYLIAAQFSGEIYDSRSLFIFGTILVASRARTSSASRKPRAAEPIQSTPPTTTSDRFSSPAMNVFSDRGLWV